MVNDEHDEHRKFRDLMDEQLKWHELMKWGAEIASSILASQIPTTPLEPKLRLANGNQIDCCGTCRLWFTRSDDRYCPIVNRSLPQSDLRYWQCAAWQQELYESYAVELAKEIGDLS